MRIVQVTMEFAPFAKAGGLGEVALGLCRELNRQGAKVEVFLPKYDFISPLSHLKKELEFKSPEWEHSISNTMWSATAEECNLHLLETNHPKKLFSRGTIYGCEDDIPRFLFFARALLEYFKIKNEPIDILHLHDWHAAALAPLLREVHREIKVKKIVLSIHNLEYQGLCSNYDLAAIGLKKEHIAALQSGSHYNLLKGAIHYADEIVAVSPSYAREILTSEYGFGLEGELQRQKGRLTGILNGLDSVLWDPMTDPGLVRRYSIKDAQEAKRENRGGIAMNPDLIWFGAISRLVSQKGPKLIEAALREAVRQNCGFALLGSPQTPEIRKHFEKLQREYANNPQVFIHLEHDEALAHRLFAALDFFVIPSLFEPCGLTQMIAMRYGTVPIVRSTGGLKDTVFDCGDPHIPPSKRNGFTFLPFTSEAVAECIDRAAKQFRNDPASHQQLIRNGMATDFSWKRGAQEYLKLYKAVSTMGTK